MSNVCEHGSLARSCEICERDQEIEKLIEQTKHYQKIYRDAHQRAVGFEAELNVAKKQLGDATNRIAALERELNRRNRADQRHRSIMEALNE